MFSTTNISDKWNLRGFERMLSYEQYHNEKSRLWSSTLKKIVQPSWKTTRRNYKHIPQIVCISSRFWVLHLLSWEFEQPEVLWRYNVILVCHLKHVEVGWSTRRYPHTGHMTRRDLSPPQCYWVNQCFLPCLDKEKIITKFEIKDLMKS